jgi:hypothetical protein
MEVTIESVKNSENQEKAQELRKFGQCIIDYLNSLNQDNTIAYGYLKSRWGIWVCNFHYLMDPNLCKHMIERVYFREDPIMLIHEYNKFLRRVFIVETQSMIEFIVREYAQQKNLPIKGKYSGYPEFLTVLSAVLQEKGLKEREFSRWYRFLSFFQVIRNSVHNNFWATKTIKKKNIPEWYKAKIEKGKAVDLRTQHLIIFAQKSFDFLKTMKFP